MNSLTRRRALQGGAALTALTIGVAPPAAAAPFAASDVRRTAMELAKHPFQEPDLKLPGAAGSMTYDQYRGIRFRQDRALWRGHDLPFQVGFFPRGFLYRPRVAVFEVRDGQAAPVPYAPDLFDYDDPSVRVPDDLGFAGLRVHAAINQPGQFDEFCVFLGASYFRAVGRGQQYGLSARGLAIGTGAAEPEEFPLFRTFWLERPQPQGNSLVIHALLDSPSTTGAFRFSVRPGETTVMDVESTLFPRTTMTQAGVAPLTSMYYFGARDQASSGRTRPDDWRTAVHDSAGLAGLTDRGERFWRPLGNPAAVQVGAFPSAPSVGPRPVGAGAPAPVARSRFLLRASTTTTSSHSGAGRNRCGPAGDTTSPTVCTGELTRRRTCGWRGSWTSEPAREHLRPRGCSCSTCRGRRSSR